MDRKSGALKGKLSLTWTEIATGVAIIVLGLVLLLAPGLATDVVFNVIAIGCILLGLVHVVRYCRLEAQMAVMSNDMATGLALIVGGILIWIFKGLFVSLLPILFGLVMLLGGVIQVQTTLGFRHMNVGHWYLELICAAISVVMGILILVKPFSTAMLMMRVIGISLVAEGVMDLVSRTAFKRACNNFIDTRFLD